MLLRIFYILIFVSCIIDSFAQPDLNQLTVTINIGSKNFKQIIQQLEEECGISFSYSDNILPTQMLPEKEFHEITLSGFLNSLFVPHGLNYSIINNQVVLFKNSIKRPRFSINGFIEEEGTLKDLIGATIFIKSKDVGCITNSYGFYSLKLPVGEYVVQVRCLGYEPFEKKIYIWNNTRFNIKLKAKSYNVNEVVVSYRDRNEFIESALLSLVKIDIVSLQELPGLFGENDALRNISLLPGIQSNEMSTGSIFVRGGSTEQTIFLMDEGVIYNPSHFGGFFSVFNPDVVNDISIFKSELPNSEGGALSSLVDVRLREGNYDKWVVKGGLGMISARASIEGPIVKDKSSLLVAYRRTYIDQLMKFVAEDDATQQMRFYFYDANFKFNYLLNDKNRIYLSGYSGSDSFYQFSQVKRNNNLATFRWNHLFGPNLFSNTSVVYSNNRVEQVIFESEEEIHWRSDINNIKAKVDFSYFLSKKVKLYYGYSGVIHNIVPYSYSSISESSVTEIEEAQTEQLMLNSVYFNQDSFIKGRVGIGFGGRLTHLYNSPFIQRDNKYKSILFEPNVHLSFIANQNTKFKASYNHREQPLHQLYLNMIGIAVNRWMPASNDFKPQISDNFAFGIYRNESKILSYSVEAYFRKMDNLIETLQNMQVLYSNEPEELLYRASGKVNGIEVSIAVEAKKFRATASYDYCNVLWTTNGINNNNPYPASHVKKHNFNISGVYKINKRYTVSAAWQWANGTPFTAATGKYMVDNKTYLKYDADKINTQQLPNYHRLDLSLDVVGKKNHLRRWKSYWNFSIYNAYFHKNMLGVVYFSTDEKSDNDTQILNPSYFYLYQFVPSISYRFKF